MRILKCYLANNIRNPFVNANEAAETGDDAGYWTCASCGCKLILQKRGGVESLPGLSTFCIPLPTNSL
ncbi:putative zinc ribbon protein [Pantoea agglomerans]